ncbi:hypothetical protein HOY82DRAFT_607244 [Tuber indicum]|nr:hypothetical protein HOY82DRAFT_607244 [Tuber indicum]
MREQDRMEEMVKRREWNRNTAKERWGEKMGKGVQVGDVDMEKLRDFLNFSSEVDSDGEMAQEGGSDKGKAKRKR